MYAYVDFTTEGAKNNDVAFMGSPPLPTTSATCLTFWYDMFGQSPGHLYIEMVNKYASF